MAGYDGDRRPEFEVVTVILLSGFKVKVHRKTSAFTLGPEPQVEALGQKGLSVISLIMELEDLDDVVEIEVVGHTGDGGILFPKGRNGK
jgi:hypothetical protein